MKVLVVSGIWPPDVGGPASHAPEVAGWLLARGHRVEVVTTARRVPPSAGYPVHWTSRRLPKGVLHLHTTSLVRRRAAAAGVVYTTGMFGRSALGALVARTPYVVKLTADPAFERARRRGEVSGDVEDFQRGGGGLRGVAYRAARDAELRRAFHVFCPSAWLRDLALTWGLDPARVSVLPNPAPTLPKLAPRDELKRSFGANGATLAFAGRLTVQKSLGLALEERAQALGIADRVRFLGPQPRERVVELFRAADASILSSSWENFPHTVVEALAAGTPVLATATGGVAEVVEDEVNGLLVPPGDADSLAAAVRRFFADADLRSRLREHAAASVAAYARDSVFERLEQVLAAAAQRG